MKLIVCAAIALFSANAALAANGTDLIGISPQSVSMGGTGTATPATGADALYKNAAGLNDLPGVVGSTTVEVDAALIDFKSKTDAGLGLKTNNTEYKVLPSVAAVYKFNENLAFGLGLLSYGGAAVDQVGQTELREFKTQLYLLRIIPAASYRVNKMISVAIAPFLKYGSLALNEDVTSGTGAQSTRSPHGAVGVGGQIGVTVKPIENLTVGASYQTKSGVTYSSVIDLDRFGANATGANSGLDDIKVQSPQEASLGVSYAMDAFLFSADYRFINWANADAFSSLGWNNQHVLGVGVQYSVNPELVVRVGFNYAQSPISEVSGEVGDTQVDFQGHSLSASSITTLNQVAFPATSKSHFAIGAGYKITSAISADASFQYAPEVTTVRSGTATNPRTGVVGPYSFTSKLVEWQVNGNVKYAF